MSARETFIAERIDRRRERVDARDARTARQRHLSLRASSLLLAEIAELPERDRADFTECLVIACRAQLVIHHGEASSAAILSREAHEAARNLLPKASAREAAERIFTPANDRDAK